VKTWHWLFLLSIMTLCSGCIIRIGIEDSYTFANPKDEDSVQGSVIEQFQNEATCE
jgi:hypothetical protein